MKKRLTAMLLVVCMLFTMMPAVGAYDGDEYSFSKTVTSTITFKIVNGT